MCLQRSARLTRPRTQSTRGKQGAYLYGFIGLMNSRRVSPRFASKERSAPVIIIMVLQPKKKERPGAKTQGGQQQREGISARLRWWHLVLTRGSQPDPEEAPRCGEIRRSHAGGPPSGFPARRPPQCRLSTRRLCTQHGPSDVLRRTRALLSGPNPLQGPSTSRVALPPAATPTGVSL